MMCLLAAGLSSGCQQSTENPTLAAPSPSATQAAAPSPSNISPTPSAGQALLEVRGQADKRIFTREQLLTDPRTETITLVDEAAFQGQSLTFRAIPVSALFQGISVSDGETIEYNSLDGFSSSLEPTLLLNTKPEGAIAYLAIEDPAEPWPKLSGGGGAGPLYLVWKNARLSRVGREQWPFQVASFTVKTPLSQRFPAILPDPSLAQDHIVQLGFQGFVKNCFPCHTMNEQGNSKMGPDLNVPHSPTEYLQPEFLQKLIRDPQSLRHWPASRMTGFPESALSDVELEQIVAYLTHMSGRRPSVPLASPPAP